MTAASLSAFDDGRADPPEAGLGIALAAVRQGALRLYADALGAAVLRGGSRVHTGCHQREGCSGDNDSHDYSDSIGFQTRKNPGMVAGAVFQTSKDRSAAVRRGRIGVTVVLRLAAATGIGRDHRGTNRQCSDSNKTHFKEPRS